MKIADERSVSMVTPETSVDDLLSAFDSMSFAQHPEQKDDEVKDTSETVAFVSIGVVDPHGQRFDKGNHCYKFDTPDSVCIAEASTKRDGEAEVVVESDETCKTDHPLIVYTSSRRSARKLDQNHEPHKPPRTFKRTAIKRSTVNLTDLQISRRKRSLLSMRARSSVWGFMGNVLPDFKENCGADLHLSSNRKPRRARGGQRIRNALCNQTSRKSRGQACNPSGRISLKIKIGKYSLDNFGKNFNASERILGEEVARDMKLPCERNFEDVMSTDTSVLSANFDTSNIITNPHFSNSKDCQQIISRVEVHNLEASIDNRSTDPGTSPDSEVINSVPDYPIFGKVFPNTQGSPIMSNACVSVEDVSCFNLQKNKSKKGKKKHKIRQASKCNTKINATGIDNKNNAEVPATLGLRQNVGNLSSCEETSTLTIIKPHSNEMNLSAGLLVASDSSNQPSCGPLIPCKVGKKLPTFSRENGRSKSIPAIMDVPSKRDKVSKTMGNQNKSDGRPNFSEAAHACSVLSGIESQMATGNSVPSDHEETRALSKSSIGQVNSFHISVRGVGEEHAPMRNAWVLCDECEKWRRIPASLADQIEETNCGWTCKDNTDKDFADCSIPQEKSNAEINDELEISDASCEEDAFDGSLKSILNQSKVSQQSSWSLIKSNLFLHRNHKTQNIDEVMVCHCKPPSDGRMGCGAKCLNRMLNIECVRGTCPCGELCSNQQFQRRKYAKLKWFRCGKKGHGLQALDDISEGQFLIEYVGEVLDVHTYEARQREYALKGHKHFYFMTLNGSEVIDACAKGNLGRFINHSCDPNCRTEKWMVNGEVCVGLFAVKDIKKGDEVTFDYNYVRVFGAAAKKCVCGSHNCRGYIGGDPSNSEVIVQGDSDDEFSEPLMMCEDKEMNDDWNDIMSNFINERVDKIASESPVNAQRANKLEYDVGPLESPAEAHSLTQKVKDVICALPQHLETSVPTLKLKVDSSACFDSDADAVRKVDKNTESREASNRYASAAFEVESDDALCQMQCSVQVMNVSSRSSGSNNKKMPSDHNENSLAQKKVEILSCSAHGSEMSTSASHLESLPDTLKSKSKLRYTYVGQNKELAMHNSLVKTHHSSVSIKKVKVKSNFVNEKGTPDVDKAYGASDKSENLPRLFTNGHFEAVEEKLNELLDPEGGISKRKDASRGYLKLLFLTAASGSNGQGEAIQSNRDLSMILDALLKTKSRTVLVDIINKNGLQMLHNIMKRCRRDFIKTPILRKLLKILGYLATREILKLEHITGGPARPGVESFKDSILTLTEHTDKQVHQSARTFRDKWIPKSLRKHCFTERDDGRMELPQRSSFGRLSLLQDHWNNQGGKPSEAMDCCEVQSVTPSGTVEFSSLEPSALSGSSGTNGTKPRKRKSRWDNPVEDHLNPSIKSNLEVDKELDMNEDIPPGFSSPCNGPIIPFAASSTGIHKHPYEIVSGDSQPRFMAFMSVSYGIPSSIMRQFGVHAETSDGWAITPGVPFHPFPPLPPHARNIEDPPASTGLSEPKEKTTQGLAHHSGQKHARTSDMDPLEMNDLGANCPPGFQRWDSYNLGRKYFRQQKWNNSKLTPPWVRMRNGW